MQRTVKNWRVQHVRAGSSSKTRRRSLSGSLQPLKDIRQAMRRWAEIVERSFAHNLDRGGMRRTWLRGRENVHKRYLVHVAGHNLGILMRLLIGAGTSREAAARALAYLCFLGTEKATAIIFVAASCDAFAIVVVTVAADPA